MRILADENGSTDMTRMGTIECQTSQARFACGSSVHQLGLPRLFAVACHGLSACSRSRFTASANRISYRQRASCSGAIVRASGCTHAGCFASLSTGAEKAIGCAFSARLVWNSQIWAQWVH